MWIRGEQSFERGGKIIDKEQRADCEKADELGECQRE